MPELFILAGPNGTGKTTYYYTAIEEKIFPRDLPFINMDLITLNELGGYSAENLAQAEIIAKERMGKLLENTADFMIESNLAIQANYDWIEKMIKRGYDVTLYFLCTQFIAINIERVVKRVLEGGHYVAPSIVEHRYNVGLSYLKSKLAIFKAVYLIDTTEEIAKKMAVMRNGMLEFKELNASSWVNDVLFITERLQAKKFKNEK